MDGGIGPLLLIALLAVGCVVAVLLLVAVVLVGGVGVLAVKGRIENAKRQASEAGPEEAW